MNRALILAIVLAAPPASADVFGFKDDGGFEKCMQTDHLLEKVKTDTGSQSRLLTQDQIQARCVEAAGKLVASTKNKDLGLALVKSARRLGGPTSALDIISPLAEVAPAACNEMAVYEVLLRGLDPLLDKTKAAVKRCLRDAQFKKDFLEEKDSGNAGVAAGACTILREEKLVTSCKGSK